MPEKIKEQGERTKLVQVETKPKKTELKKETMKKQEFKKPLRCNLRNDELLKYGEEMVDTQAEVTEFEESLSSIKMEYKAKIDQHVARINVLSGVIRAKAEVRAVDCVRWFDYSRKRVFESRIDTDEIINERDISVEETQGVLKLND